MSSFKQQIGVVGTNSVSSTSLGANPNSSDQTNKDISFLTNIDFSQIDEMDPNLFNGHKIIFDQDIEFEINVINAGVHLKKV